MNDTSHFRNNLRMLIEQSDLSIVKFSKMLDMPRTTVQSVMKDGQTTLDTACRMANALKIPLCTMTGGELATSRVKVVQNYLGILEWYVSLSMEKRKAIRTTFCLLLELLEK